MRSYDDFDARREFMRKVEAIPHLTAREEADLWVRIEAGRAAVSARKGLKGGALHRADRVILEGERAVHGLTEAHLALVASIAAPYDGGHGLAFMDLVSEGVTGMMKAVEKFDTSSGNRFAAYARHYIRGAISTAVAQTGHTIRIPNGQLQDVNRLTTITRKVTAAIEREPSVEEIAAATGFTVDRVRELTAIRNTQPESLNTPIGMDGLETGDVIADDTFNPADVLSTSEAARMLNTMFAGMPADAATVLGMRTGFHNGEDMAIWEIAAETGWSIARVTRLECEALSHARHPSTVARLHANR